MMGFWGPNTPLVGDIVYSARSNMPGYLQANGQIVNQADYPALFGEVGLLAEKLATPTQRTVPTTTETANGLCYGNGLFVAVGTAGFVMSSPDGITWTQRTGASANAIGGVVYGNGKFVAVGLGGAVWTSTDGIAWNLETTPAADNLTCVAYGNGRFIAAGSGINHVWYSSDGVSWTKVTSAISGGGFGVAYGNGVYVLVAYAKTFRSLDGITWIETTPPYFTALAMTKVIYGANGLFCVTGQAAKSPFTSLDGKIWNQSTVPVEDYTYHSTYINGLSIAWSRTKIWIAEDSSLTWKRVIINASMFSTTGSEMATNGSIIVMTGQNFEVWTTAPAYFYDNATKFKLPTVPIHGIMKPWLKAA